jgi:hypothetical protein
MRTFLAVVLFLLSLVLPSAADAQARDKTERSDDDAVDIGVLGGIGFPRPFSIEPVIGLEKTVMFGAEYSFLPATKIGSVDVKTWAVAANVRVFPFRGAFFLGLRGGYQSITGETTLGVANVGSYTESMEVATWFVNPRIGFLWVWKPLAVGVDAGVQIPLSTSVSSSPLAAAALDAFGRSVIPTIDLLKVGLVF